LLNVGSDDVFKQNTWFDERVAEWLQIYVHRVAENQPVIGAEQGEGFLHGFDRGFNVAATGIRRCRWEGLVDGVFRWHNSSFVRSAWLTHNDNPTWQAR